MTAEELEFLQNLQKELNEQPNDGNADPVFWVIGDYQWELAPIGYEDELRVVCEGGEDFTITSFLEYLKDEEEYEYVLSEVDFYISDTDRIEQIIELLNDNHHECFILMGVRKQFYIVPDTLFVTKQEAIKHLKLNSHHYTREAHTYAMTALRSPVVDRLWKLLRTCDFTSLEEGARG